MPRDLYAELGVRKVINAAGTYTMVGGSRMSEETLEAMAQAARSHVVIRELQEKAHARLAELTRNEAACVTGGAAAGLHITGAAAIAKKYGRPHWSLDAERLAASEIIVHRAHRNPYDWSLRLLGAKMVEIGFPNAILPTREEDLEYAITENTAAIFYFFMPPGGWTARGALDLASTLRIAARHGVPVIVDAAAQVPPVENLWAITGRGASACIFSGGKDLHGPQASGLVVGKADFLSWVTDTAFPTYGVGRMFKVGREEIVGLLSAVEQYVSADHAGRLEWAESRIASFRKAFENSSVIRVQRVYPNEAGQPFPQMVVSFTGEGDISAFVLRRFREGDPSIFTMAADERSVFVNPMTLRDEELDAIREKVVRIGDELLAREGRIEE